MVSWLPGPQSRHQDSVPQIDIMRGYKESGVGIGRNGELGMTGNRFWHADKAIPMTSPYKYEPLILISFIYFL